MIDDAAASSALVLYLLFFAIPLYFEIRRKSMGFKEVGCVEVEELLPCPFCGSDDVGPITFKGCNGDVWDEFIACGGCGATAETVEAWNTRAECTCHIEVHDNLAETDGMGDVWLECDECHWQMPLEPTTPRFKHCPNCGAKVIE